MTLIPINRVERDGRYRLPLVTLADGRPAWERNRRVTQTMLNQYGSRDKALAALEGANA